MAQGLQEIDDFEVKSVLGKCSALTFRLHLHLHSFALRKGTIDEAWEIIILSCWRIGAKAGGWTVWIPVSVSSQFITSSCFLIPPQTILGSFHSTWFPHCTGQNVLTNLWIQRERGKRHCPKPGESLWILIFKKQNEWWVSVWLARGSSVSLIKRILLASRPFSNGQGKGSRGGAGSFQTSKC